jgi:hypothetical protein
MAEIADVEQQAAIGPRFKLGKRRRNVVGGGFFR